MTRAVVVDGVTRRFESVTALDAVSFEVEAGELFGFVGADGSGKTTLFRILATLLTPDAGRAELLGLDVVRELWSLRRRIGYMPGRFSLYPDLSVEENLRFFASVFGTTVEAEYATIAPIYEQLAPFATRRAGALSGGMKQKLALCCALVHRPDILLLDEPTTGVDAVSRREFWDLLHRLRDGGLTIVVSTPYMDEAGRCDRIAMIQRGRLLGIDTPGRVAASFQGMLFTVTAEPRYRALLALRAWPHAATAQPFGDTIHYTDRRGDLDPAEVARQIREHLAAQGIAEARVVRAEPTVEDTFMQRMGEPERAA